MPTHPGIVPVRQCKACGQWKPEFFDASLFLLPVKAVEVVRRKIERWRRGASSEEEVGIRCPVCGAPWNGGNGK